MDTQEKHETDNLDLNSVPKKARKSPWSSITIFAGSSFLVLGLLALGILPRVQRQSELNAFAKSATVDLPTVNVIKPKLAANTTELVLPGSIQANQETTVYARSSGYLRQRFADIGDRVHTGEFLALIDTPEADQDVQQARAELAKAEANLAQAHADLAQKQSNFSQAKANLKAKQAELTQAQANLKLANKTWQRWQALNQQGAVALQDADERQTAYSASQANVDSLISSVRSEQDNVNTALAGIDSQKASIDAFVASVGASKANLQRLSVLQSFKRVVAPFPGVITARNVDTGALISAGSNSNSANAWLFKIAQTGTLRIRINVPQAFIQSIHQGQTALLHVRELPTKTFTGKIVRTADSLDPNSNTLVTEIQVQNSGNILRPGMYAEVTFKTNRANPPLLVPANTLVINADGTQVVTVTPEHKIQYQKIEVGRDYGTEVEIISGLNPNVMLITNPTNDLQEGGRVDVIAMKSKNHS
ncbi:efflux RND transporter periplasmic adaptor subunit [Nostoc sp. C117]|uniref:efflux RND transporter periplasmic adaptor subunit n=1 Tax=Nostoc sp. C117 TaxID=3349875 RepID=UPI00370D3CA9